MLKLAGSRMVRRVLSVLSLGGVMGAGSLPLGAQEVGLDLAIEISSSVQVAAPGQEIVYSVAVTNLGAVPASGVVVAGSFGEGAAVLDPGGATLTQSRPMSWSLGELAAGERRILSVRAMHETEGAFRSLMTVVGSGSEGNLANNSAQALVRVREGSHTALLTENAIDSQRVGEETPPDHGYAGGQSSPDPSTTLVSTEQRSAEAPSVDPSGGERRATVEPGTQPSRSHQPGLDPRVSHLEVCVTGGGGRFRVLGSGQVTSGQPSPIDQTFRLDVGECRTVFGVFVLSGANTAATVTVVHTPDAGFALRSVLKTAYSLAAPPLTTPAVNGATITVTDDLGWVVTFENGPEPKDGPVIDVEKTGPESVSVSETFDYTIEYEVVEGGPALNFALSDTLPADVAFVSATNGPSLDGRVLSWPIIPSFDVGDPRTETVTVRAPAEPGELRNVALVEADDAAPDTSVATTVVEDSGPGSTIIAVEKRGPETVSVGDTFTYTIEYGVKQGGPATNFVLSDTLPAAVEFLGATRGPSLVGRVLTWPSIPALPAGNLLAVTVTVRAPPDPGELTNIAVVEADNAASDTSVVRTKVGDGPIPRPTVIDVAKQGPERVTHGQTFDYVIRYKASGTVAATNFILSDTLPAELDFVDATGDPELDGRVLTWLPIASLPTDDPRTETVTVRVPPGLGPEVRVLRNVALGEAENAQSDTSVVVTQLDGPRTVIDVEKRGPERVNVGQMFDYTIEYEVTVGGPAANFVLSDTLPFLPGDSASGLFLEATGDPRLDGGVLTWPEIDLFERGQRRTETVTLRAPEEPGQLRNIAVVTADDVPPDTAVVITVVDPNGDGGGGGGGGDSIDVRIEKTGPASALLGEEVLYTLTVRNVGADTARQVVVTDTLPVGIRFVRASDEGSGFGRVFRWPPIAELAPDSAVTYTLAALPVAVGTHTNVVTVTTDPQDGDLSDNRDEVTTRVATSPFSDEAYIMGKVFVDCGCEPDQQADGEQGVPGVRIYLQDGTSALTDFEGEYHFFGLRPNLWVVKVDLTTLPEEARLVPLTNRHGGDGATAFVDLKRNELARADFAEGSGHPQVLGEVFDRRTRFERDGTFFGQHETLAAGVTTRELETFTPLLPATPLLVGDFPMDTQAGGQRPPVSPAEVPQTAHAPRESLVAAGLVEARVDLRSLTNGDLGSGLQRDRFEEELRSFQFESDDGQVTGGARAALFMRGTVGETYDVTLRVESEESDRSRLFRDIRPDELYPIYGDNSIREFEAQSKGRVFGQVQSGASALLFGDFTTGYGSYGQTGARALGRYSRTLNGVLEHFETERASINGFASRDRFMQIVEEFEGEGISGPYELRRSDGLVNSERVELIVRDRNQRAVILRTEPMERFTDYSVEPFTGRIIFRQPIPSIDGELNPVSIRVTYEVEGRGDRFWVLGADGQFRPWERLELGGGFVRDDNPIDRFDLASVNATLGVGAGTYLFGEFARTDGMAAVSGDASRAGLRHESDRLTARFLFLETDRTFDNPSSAFDRGRRELSVRLAARVQDQTRFFGELISTQDRVKERSREGARFGIERALGEWVRAQLAYRYADDSGVRASEGSEEDPGELSTIGARFGVRLPQADRLELSAEFEQDVSESERRRAWVGADYTIPNLARLYGRHEFISSFVGPFELDPEAERHSTVFGIAADVRSGQTLFSEYRVRDAIGGRESQAALGLRNTWAIGEQTRLSTSVERLSPLSKGGKVATSVTTGIEVTGDSLWVGSARAEYWDRNGADQVFGSLGYALKLSSDFSLLGSTVFSTELHGDRAFERTRLGVAWRETSRNRWNALARYEHRYDESADVLEPGATRSAHIFWTHVNYQPTDAVVLRGNWASKSASGERAAAEFSEASHLMGVRGTMDVTERTDLGLIGRAMFSSAYDDTQYGLGAEVGFLLADDVRVAAGYNVFGLRDVDFAAQEEIDHGFYLHLGFKFDEGLFGTSRPQAELPDPDALRRCACDCPQDPCPSLSLVVSGPATAAPADTIPFEIQVINLRTAPAEQVLLTDTIPIGTDFVSASNGGAISNGVVTWPAIPTLEAGAMRTDTVWVQAPLEADTLVNVAVVSADGFASTRSLAETVVDVALPVLLPPIDLALLGPGEACRDEVLDYEIRVSHQGPSAISPLLSLFLEPGLRYLAATPEGQPSGPSGQTLVWSIDGLAPGPEAVIEVQVAADSAGSHGMTALASSPGLLPAEASLSTTVADCPPPGRVVQVEKRPMGSDTVLVGDTVGYVIQVTNQGDSVASGISLRDFLPAGAVFVYGSRDPELEGYTLAWQPFALEPGLSRTDTVLVLAPDRPGRWVNLAVADADSSTAQTVLLPGPVAPEPPDTVYVTVVDTVTVVPDTVVAVDTLVLVRESPPDTVFVVDTTLAGTRGDTVFLPLRAIEVQSCETCQPRGWWWLPWLLLLIVLLAGATLGYLARRVWWRFRAITVLDTDRQDIEIEKDS